MLNLKTTHIAPFEVKFRFKAFFRIQRKVRFICAHA